MASRDRVHPSERPVHHHRVCVAQPGGAGFQEDLGSGWFWDRKGGEGVVRACGSACASCLLQAQGAQHIVLSIIGDASHSL
jgi:hypothetical protein